MRTFFILTATAAIAGAAPATAAILEYQSTLSTLNASGVTGTASFLHDTSANTLRVSVSAGGLTPNTVHPQHIHGAFATEGCTDVAPPGSAIAGACLDGNTAVDSTVPTLADDIDGDGYVETLEGAQAYGPIILTLGDAAAGRDGLPGSFPMSDAAGALSFETTYDLGSTDLLFDSLNGIEHEVGDLFPLTDRVFVIHGLFVDNDQPAVDNDMFEVQGPTEDYVVLLPVAAGEIEFVRDVPAPGALGLLGVGLLGLGWTGASRRRKA